MNRPYRAEDGVPPMPNEGAPGPLTKKQRMGKMVIGKPSDLTPEERKQMSRMPDEGAPPMKKMAAGGYTKAADGCCKRGKTRGKMV